jgi:hypothetical protein
MDVSDPPASSPLGESVRASAAAAPSFEPGPEPESFSSPESVIPLAKAAASSASPSPTIDQRETLMAFLSY